MWLVLFVLHFLSQGSISTNTLDAGWFHVCARQQSSEVFCWGDNQEGQFGVGSDARYYISSTPVQMQRVNNASDVSCAFHVTCIVDQGIVKCAGANYHNQLGGSTQDRSSPYILPVSLPVDTQFVSVDAGGCALSSTRDLYCWGNLLRLSAVPVLIDSGVDQVSVGFGGHVCFVQSGKLLCWGANRSGQIGLDPSDVQSSFKPVHVSSVSNVRQVMCGAYHTCVLLDSGAVKCFGLNTQGELGDGTVQSSFNPVLAIRPRRSTILGKGVHHQCIITQFQTAGCWGKNNFGQLGIGSSSPSSPLVSFGDGVEEITTIVGGDDFTCAQFVSGDIRCLGHNPSGQFGDGTFLSSKTLVSTKFTTISPTAAPTFKRPTLAPTFKPTRAPTFKQVTRAPSVNAKCTTTVPLSSKKCKKLIKFCQTLRVPMKFKGKKCPLGNELGCYCKGFCGYRCENSCKGDKECLWDLKGKRCTTKAGFSTPIGGSCPKV